MLAFFEASGRNLLAADRAAGVGHHVALSVVGTDRLQQSGYFRAKAAQERLIRQGGVPYTIVQSTQFFEFVAGIAQSGTAADGKTVRLSPASIQPIASGDIAAAVADAALEAPANGVIEVAGPERFRLSDLVQTYLTAIHDPRTVVAEPGARYFGAEIQDGTFARKWIAENEAGKPQYEAWLKADRESQIEQVGARLRERMAWLNTPTAEAA